MNKGAFKIGLFWLMIATAHYCSFAQDSSKLDKAIALPAKLFASLDKKAAFIELKLDRQTDRYLNKLQRQENKLRRKLFKKDSTLAKQLFDGVEEKYNQFKNTTGNVSK